MTNLNEMAREIEEWVLSKEFRSDRARIWELFALAHTEISEAVDAYKKGQPDEVIGLELTDALIRIIHLMQIFGVDIDRLYNQRMDYNWLRPTRFNTARSIDTDDN